MEFQAKLCITFVGIIFSSILQLLDSRKLEGYEFPVYSTDICPRNQIEWNKRSSAINCTETNGYMCLPNENLTELTEFCYMYPRILIENDLCLYLIKRYSRVDSYNCTNFTQGCPTVIHFSSETFKYPSCHRIKNGCYVAEPDCKRTMFPILQKRTNQESFERDQIKRRTTDSQETYSVENNHNKQTNTWALPITFLGVFVTVSSIYILCIYIKKNYNPNKISTIRPKESSGRDYIAVLLDYRADINPGDIKRCSNLYNAAQNGHDSTVKLLPKMKPP